MERYRRQTSANKLTKDLTATGRPFMWHKIIADLPCESPESTVTASDPSLLPTTVRKSVSQSLILPSIIYYVRFHLMEVLLVGTLSKAFEESMVNMSIRSPESNFPRRYCTVIIS